METVTDSGASDIRVKVSTIVDFISHETATRRKSTQ